MRRAGEGVHAGERLVLGGNYSSGLPKTLYGSPTWHERSELVVIQRLQEHKFPAKRRSKKNGRAIQLAVNYSNYPNRRRAAAALGPKPDINFRPDSSKPGANSEKES